MDTEGWHTTVQVSIGFWEQGTVTQASKRYGFIERQFILATALSGPELAFFGLGFWGSTRWKRASKWQHRKEHGRNWYTYLKGTLMENDTSIHPEHMQRTKSLTVCTIVPHSLNHGM